ncbi:MAG TPA: hypothetical protein VNB90_01705 [Cytophagaceae bacterium]|jgi:hypothetical protein|nr:hypothetical protein [Cytophagaceae bacterium]
MKKTNFMFLFIFLSAFISCKESKQANNTSDSSVVNRTMSQDPIIYIDSSVFNSDSLMKLYVKTENIKDSFPQKKYCFLAESPSFKNLKSHTADSISASIKRSVAKEYEMIKNDDYESENDFNDCSERHLYYEVNLINKNLLSFVYIDMTRAIGLSNYSFTNTYYNYDLKRSKEIKLNDLIKEGKCLDSLYIVAKKMYYKYNALDMDSSQINFPDRKLYMEGFGISATNLLIYLPEKEGSFMEREQVSIQYEEIKGCLNQEGPLSYFLSLKK